MWNADGVEPPDDRHTPRNRTHNRIGVAMSLDSVRLENLARGGTKGEKETPASTLSGAVLGLGAFMLAFTFGMVADRYDARKALVREDANAIRTAYMHADFLSEFDRLEARRVLGAYLDQRLAFVQAGNVDQRTADTWCVEAVRIQRRLWAAAVANARKDMNSDVAAL